MLLKNKENKNDQIPLKWWKNEKIDNLFKSTDTNIFCLKVNKISQKLNMQRKRASSVERLFKAIKF